MPSKHALSWAGSRLIAALSDQLLLFAIPILVYRKTGSLALSGMAYFLEWLPRVASPLVAGLLVDFFCSKRVAIVADAIRCVLCLIAYSILLIAPEAPFWIYAAIAGAVGLLWETSFLAFDISLSRTSEPSDLPKTQSIIQGVEQFALIFGPGVAAGLATLVNLPSLFLVSGVLFLIASVVTTLTNAPQTESQPVSVKAALKLISDGYLTLVKEPVLFRLVVLCFVQNVAVGLAMSLSPGYLQEGLQMKETAFGMLTMVSGVTSIALFFSLPGVLNHISLWTLCRAAAILSPLALVIMGLSTHFIPYFIGFSLIIGVDGALSIIMRTVRTAVVPPERLGSVVAAIIFVLNIGFPLGGVLLALLAPILSGSWVLISIASCCAFVLVFTIPQLGKRFRLLPVAIQGKQS